jgi:hypothetical protein
VYSLRKELLNNYAASFSALIGPFTGLIIAYRGQTRNRRLFISWDYRASGERGKGRNRATKTLPREGIRPLTPLSLEDARRIVAGLVREYNTVRLHSGISYRARGDTPSRGGSDRNNRPSALSANSLQGISCPQGHPAYTSLVTSGQDHFRESRDDRQAGVR